MKCLKPEEVFAYAQHLLEAREEAAARAHLAECAACRSLLDQYERLDRVLGEWEPVEPSASFDARLAEAVRRAEVARARRWLVGPESQGWLAPACLLALVAVASVVFVRSTRRAAPLPERSLATNLAPAGPGRPAAPSADTADDELNLYKDLPVLENYDLLAEFDVLSELSGRSKNLSE